MEAADPTENLTWFNQEMDECASAMSPTSLNWWRPKGDLCRPGGAPRAAGGLLSLGGTGLRHFRRHPYADGTMHVIDYKHGLGILSPQWKILS